MEKGRARGRKGEKDARENGSREGEWEGKTEAEGGRRKGEKGEWEENRGGMKGMRRRRGNMTSRNQMRKKNKKGVIKRKTKRQTKIDDENTEGNDEKDNKDTRDIPKQRGKVGKLMKTKPYHEQDGKYSRGF